MFGSGGTGRTEFQGRMGLRQSVYHIQQARFMNVFHHSFSYIQFFLVLPYQQQQNQLHCFLQKRR